MMVSSSQQKPLSRNYQLTDTVHCSLILPQRPESGVTHWNFHHFKLLRMYALVKDMTLPLCLPCSTFGFISFHQGGLKCLKLPLLYSLLPSPPFTSKVPPWLWSFFYFFNYSFLALCIANERLKGIFLWKALLQYVFFFFLIIMPPLLEWNTNTQTGPFCAFVSKFKFMWACGRAAGCCFAYE